MIEKVKTHRGRMLRGLWTSLAQACVKCTLQPLKVALGIYQSTVAVAPFRADNGSQIRFLVSQHMARKYPAEQVSKENS